MYDLIVVGGGPGGTAVASYVAKEGKKVLLIEKSSFPRFKIGESLLPYSMTVFNDLGFDKTLATGDYLKKVGALFIDSNTNSEVYFDFTNKGQAKFPFSYEVERARFDTDFLNFSTTLGVEVRQPEQFIDCELLKESVRVKTNKGLYESKYIVDASGGLSVIANKFGRKEVNHDYNNNFAVYSHFEDISRSHQRDDGDITIGILKNSSWSWTIPFYGNKTSIGVVSSRNELSKEKNLESFFNMKLDENLWLKEILATGKRTLDFQLASNFSRSPGVFVGERWGALGDAVGFLDPVFSSGVHVSLMSAKFLSQNIIKSLSLPEIGLNSSVNSCDYELTIRRGILRFHNLLQMFYSGEFIRKVESLSSRERAMAMMTKAVAGGMWDEDNTLFRTGVL